MNAAETIRALASGELADGGLLHGARMLSHGREMVGPEAIVGACRRYLTLLSSDATVVQGENHIALFDTETAWFADVSANKVARLWRLCAGAAEPAALGVSVAIDVDMSQAGGSLLFAQSDHPALEADATPIVTAIGMTLVRNDWAAHRTRAFVVRAFGTGATGAALFAVYRLPLHHSDQSPGFIMTAAGWQGEDWTVVQDQAGADALRQTPWTPRVAK